MDSSPRSDRVREIRSARPTKQRLPDDLHTVTAQLSLSSVGLARLLSVSGSQSEFILASVDGSTTVHARLAISAVPDGQQLLGGELSLDWSRGVLSRGNRAASLSRMELRLLAALMDGAPEQVSRQVLVARLWPGGDTRSGDRERALSVWIFQLRRRFAAIGLYDVIRTIRGNGYALRV